MILFASSSDRAKMGLRAHNDGLITTNWAWLTESKLNSKKELEAGYALSGWIYFQAVLPKAELEDFVEKVKIQNSAVFGVTTDAQLSAQDEGLLSLHDAVMLYAHAATRVLSEGGDLQDGQAVTKAVRSTRFEGYGGSVVALDTKGDRIESYEVMNYVLEADGAIGR